MSQSTDQKVAEVAAKHEAEAKAAEQRARQALEAQSEPDRGYDHWLQQRRAQDARKAQEKAEERARQAVQQVPMTPETQAMWNAWFTQSFANLFGDHFTAACKPVMEDVAEVLAKDRRVRLEEDEKVVSEVENWVNGRLETKVLPRIETVEQRVAQQIGRTDALAETVTAERTARESDVRTAIADLKQWASERPETKLLERIETLELRFGQYAGQTSGRIDALAEAIAAERAARENEIRTAVADVKDWTSERPETKLLQRLETLEVLLAEHIGKSVGRADALAEAITAEREARENDAKAVVDEMKHFVGSEFQTELAALADRMKAMPGKLPVAKTWQAESVTYEGQIASYGGSLWQACKDTAQVPGGSDWLLVARAGRDAVMPRVVGTYDAHKTYKALDIVASDGGAFCARRDNPGILGQSDGWQLICRQGRPGRRGDRGPAGPKGERGEKGPTIMPAIVSTKIEDFKLVVLREDKSLEIFDLRPAFENYHNEINNRYDG
jgi:hypothetical protein